MKIGPPAQKRPKNSFGIEIGLLMIVIAVCIYLARNWRDEAAARQTLPPPAQDEAEKIAKQRKP